MDEILRFLQTWLSRRRDATGAPLLSRTGDSPDVDEILPALESELGALLERLRLELGDERVDQWLKGETGSGLGRMEPDVADWVTGRKRGGLPALKKAVAFVQLLSHERGFETVGKIDGRFGPKTQETLPSLAVYELRLVELVQRWLSEHSYDLGSELGELGEKTRRALDEELANDERVPAGWRRERRLVAFGQLLCRRYGFEQVGSIDGWLGPSTRSALGLLTERLARGPRIGLALSGGGFRASIFHLGVIRRLEELGIMSRVDVISSVSGGSIIAAYYVIEMERRLDLRPPPPPDDPSYARYLELERQERLKVFEDIADDFLRATNHNLRIRALLFAPFFHPLAALKLLRPGFTRADLFQAEYDRWFFRGNTLAELPLDASSAHRVHHRSGPKLVINATSLLTGNRIAFSREALSDIKQLSKVNTNVLRLSRVVGASAGVPGLFPPTPIGGDLLVDGGVSDNQGLQGLWNEGCDVLLVSDASGQMERAHRLKQRAVSVIKRTNSIFQHQIRNQLVRRMLQWRRIAPPEWEREFAFVHLFLSREDPQDVGVPSEFVAALGRIRTDLDEFNPVEREALMYHGYSLIDSQIKERCPNLWNRCANESWAPPSVRNQPAVSRLFDEARLLNDMILDGVEPNAKLFNEVVLERRGELKRTLEAGARGFLIRRAMNRHGLKAVLLLVLSWLLPLLIFAGLAWRPLENAIVSAVRPFAEDLGSVFAEPNLPDWLRYLSSPLAGVLDRWSDWPITLEGITAGAIFLLVNYVLVFFAFSVLRRRSRVWDKAAYARLTAGGDPEDAWPKPESEHRESPGAEPDNG